MWGEGFQYWKIMGKYKFCTTLTIFAFKYCWLWQNLGCTKQKVYYVKEGGFQRKPTIFFELTYLNNFEGFWCLTIIENSNIHYLLCLIPRSYYV